MKAIELFNFFFEAKTQMHQLHHLTFSFSEHKALGKFYERWDELADTFIETYQGKYGRIDGDYNINTSDKIDAGLYLLSIKDKLIQFLTTLEKVDLDLENIIADMLALCNHTQYLLTLK